MLADRIGRNRTESLEVSNFVFNVISGIKMSVPKSSDVKKFKIKFGNSFSNAELVLVLMKEHKAKVVPPKLNGLSCVQVQSSNSGVLQILKAGIWPNGKYKMLGKGTGIAEISFSYVGAEKLPAVNSNVMVEVIGNNKPDFGY